MEELEFVMIPTGMVRETENEPLHRFCCCRQGCYKPLLNDSLKNGLCTGKLQLFPLQDLETTLPSHGASVALAAVGVKRDRVVS